MDNPGELDWWGYVHANGSIQIKRWFGDQRDIDEAKESDFVENTYGPFKAVGREGAKARIQVLHEAHLISWG